jgi:hypothetical protein
MKTWILTLTIFSSGYRDEQPFDTLEACQRAARQYTSDQRPEAEYLFISADGAVTARE